MRIAVVGAGLAGLRATMLLEEQGAHVDLYEARQRVGGRVHTVRDAHGLGYEAGGEWIDADHSRVLGILKRFGIPVTATPIKPYTLSAGGSRIPETQLWPEAKADMDRLDAEARGLAEALKDPVWSNRDRTDLDERNLADFLSGIGTSDRGRWWMRANLRSDEGEDPERIGLLGWLGGYRNYLNRTEGEASAFRVEGGLRLLIQALSRATKAQPQFDRLLQGIRTLNDGVELQFSGATAKADKVLLTLPPWCLTKIDFDPALEVGAYRAFRQCGMTRTVKVAWQFKRAWWLDEGMTGFLMSDAPFQQIWPAHAGDAPTLIAYVNGDDADTLRKGTPESALKLLASQFPAAEAEYERGWIHDWVRDPYAGGGFAYAPPGYVLGGKAWLSRAQYRIHFAGEHTARWNGFLEGALESAERVVWEILGQ